MTIQPACTKAVFAPLLLIFLAWPLTAAAQAETDPADSTADSGLESEQTSAQTTATDATADGTADADAWAPIASTPEAAPSLPAAFRTHLSEKFKAHGYLNQALVVGSSIPYVGIGNNVSADYRTAALQFGYRPTANDRLVIQLQHKRLGVSPTQALFAPVDIDWVFYERTMKKGFSLRAGKVQIPLGIFNEIRDVGTLLPMYRAPVVIYQEGLWLSEAMDGFILGWEGLIGDSDWLTSLELYYGFWDMATFDSLSNVITVRDIDNGAGLRWWLETPLDGLRIGTSGYRADVKGGITPGVVGPDQFDVGIMWIVSLDAALDWFTARVEFERVWFDNLESWATSAYGQLIVPIYKGFAVVGQAEAWNLHVALPASLAASLPTGNVLNLDLVRDYGIALRYDLNAFVTFKIEGHLVDNVFPEDRVYNYIINPMLSSKYMISSVAVSF